MPMKPGLALNEDCNHFFCTRGAEDMTIEGLNALIDNYAGEQVSQILLNPNGMRTLYRSKVWDYIGEPPAGASRLEIGFVQKWLANLRILDEKGIDHIAVWIDRCREHGISPWLSMRMNDIHNTNDPDAFGHSEFWRAHPEYRRNPQGRAGGADQAFDYGREEVREYHFRLIEELFERYDFDGFELDWMRSGYHFRPGLEDEGCDILTNFMARVRTFSKPWSNKRGHPIRIGVRVPSRPDTARDLGMDGVRWACEGLVDQLVVTPRFAAADFDIPIEQWRELLGPAAESLTLAAGLENGLSIGWPYPRVRNDAEGARGIAVSAYHRGADQIYLFNHMDSQTTIAAPEDLRIILNELGRPETALQGPRRHVVTFTDIVPIGAPIPRVLPFDADLEAGGYSPNVRMYIGPKPAAGGATLRIGLAKNQGADQAVLAACLNTIPCTPMADHETPEVFGHARRVLQFDVPIRALRDGYNVAQTFLERGQKQKVIWVEIRIDPAAR